MNDTYLKSKKVLIVDDEESLRSMLITILEDENFFNIITADCVKSALEIWKKALDNVTPQIEVKSRRVGGATFQVPTEIRPDRKESISMKNLILFARKRGGKSMADKLAAEIIDAFNEQGGAYKRKEDMHRMAEANRAFAHFRF